MAIIKSGDRVLMEKRPASGIWGGLYGFFEFETSAQLEQWLAIQGITAESTELEEFKHVFSHFNLMIKPIVLNVDRLPATVGEKDLISYDLSSPPEVGLATPTKKIIKTLVGKG